MLPSTISPVFMDGKVDFVLPSTISPVFVDGKVEFRAAIHDFDCFHGREGGYELMSVPAGGRVKNNFQI